MQIAKNNNNSIKNNSDRIKKYTP